MPFTRHAVTAATWFALMASLMNLALTTGSIMSKQLNRIWLVTREVTDATGHVIVQADYHQLGYLLLAVILMSLIIPIAAVYLFLRHDLR